MTHVLIPALCGFVGGIIGLAVGAFILYRQVPHAGFLQITRGPGPEIYRDVEVLEHAPRPQGVYVHFRNTGTKPIEMANFKIRGYQDGKLWGEFEEAVYAEIRPGDEHEAILPLCEHLDGLLTFNPPDYSTIKVAFLYAYGSSTAQA
jgi:hypothetical protein